MLLSKGGKGKVNTIDLGEIKSGTRTSFQGGGEGQAKLPEWDGWAICTFEYRTTNSKLKADCKKKAKSYVGKSKGGRELTCRVRKRRVTYE